MTHTGEMLFFKKGECLFHINLKNLLCTIPFASLQNREFKLTLKHQVLFSISNHVFQWFRHSTSSQNIVANISMCIRCHLIVCHGFVSLFSLFSKQLCEGCVFVLDSKDHAAVIDVTAYIYGKIRSGHKSYYWPKEGKQTQSLCCATDQPMTGSSRMIAYFSPAAIPIEVIHNEIRILWTLHVALGWKYTVWFLGILFFNSYWWR